MIYYGVNFKLQQFRDKNVWNKCKVPIEEMFSYFVARNNAKTLSIQLKKILKGTRYIEQRELWLRYERETELFYAILAVYAILYFSTPSILSSQYIPFHFHFINTFQIGEMSMTQQVRLVKKLTLSVSN